MICEELLKLSKEELVDMLLRLQRPDKTSRTSSKPPSSDRKQRREDFKPGGAKPGHDGHSRALSENPDEFQDHQPTHCPHCLLPFAADAERKLIGEYDEIELPPVRPFVRRHRRYAINCQCCAQSTPAPLPAVVKGTPFGPRIHAQAIYLKSVQALSYERLRKAFLDMFGLVISEGAIMNMLRRMSAAFEERRQNALAVLRQAEFVASDETGMRIEGVNGYQWVFHCKNAVVHLACFTRSASVVREAMAGHRPKVWSSDRYGGQQGHAQAHQTCLAHLDRKARYVDENSQDDTAMRLKLWLDRAFALAREITQLAASTIRTKQRRLERDIEAILRTPTSCALSAELIGQFARARDQLLTFCRYPGEVGPTNNDCERDLRPSVVQRKVTNGHRALWAAEAETAVRTTLDTARLAGAGPFQTILQTIAP